MRTGLQRGTKPRNLSRIVLRRAVWERIERKELTLTHLNETRCVAGGSINKSARNHRWFIGCQSLYFLEALGSNTFIMCCSLCRAHHQRDCVPASSAAHSITPYLLHVASSFILCRGESGMHNVFFFWGGVVFGFKGCVTICLCYKRQVGWRAGSFLEILWELEADCADR